MKTTDSMTSYIAAFVDELVRAGVQDVIISPGSRSTPFAILMEEHPEMKTFIHVDERSAAFFGLGIAKAKRKPVALLCTSGTAAANYFPAIVEAYYSRVPLIVITADRPHELRDVGAPQAIDQNQLYGIHAKWFVDMALPEESTDMVRYVRTMAGRAAGKALSSPAGPVHLNFPLREPLVPDINKSDLFSNGRNIHTKHVNVMVGKPSLSEEEFDRIGQFVETKTKGIIVCGDHLDEEFAHNVTKLAEKLNFPILADPLSQLRSGKHSSAYIIESYDTFLKNEEFVKSYSPEMVIRFGAMPVSKSLLLYLKKHTNAMQIVIDGDGGWREPTLSATEMIYCDEKEFCKGLVSVITERASTPWLEDWLKINSATQNLLASFSDNKLFEGRVIKELQELLPQESTLFVGNSMPIRDLDTFFSTTNKNIRILANRGANGIDGVVSTALGVSVEQTNTVLLIGDLSFYHDLNGLLAAKMYDLDLTIVLINNDGGGIFSFLPQSKEEKHFEKLFGTPIGLQYSQVVKMYEGTFISVDTWEEFSKVVKKSFDDKGLSVIEIQTNRLENVQMHRNLYNRVSQEISSQLKKGH